MVLTYCIFDKCGNQRKKNGKISFFSFPKEDDLLRKWLDFVNKHNPTKLNQKLLDRDKMKICHMHFEKKQVQTKSNNDRVLLRNSIPRCPPGIVDKAHAIKKSKKKKEPKNTKAADSDKRKSGTAASNESKATQPALEGTPLYHTINGYVVDLRIAAQQDTFRLPNGKLIQVRRQPKKGSGSERKSPLQSTPQPPPKQTEAAKSPSPVPTSKDSTEKSPEPIVEEPSEEKPTSETEALGKLVPAKPLTSPVPRTSIWQESELPTPPTEAHTEKASKTYTNRRSLNLSPRTSPSFRTRPLPSQPQPRSSAAIPATPVATPRPPAAPSSQPTHAPVIIPPSLSILQTLMHKTHPDTPFGNHLKDFENRLISTAEISLHIVCKINNFLNSNSYKNAGGIRDLKELYHHVAYILKYAMGRFKGLEDDCVQDIQQMGFTKLSDLGPLLSEQVNKTPSKSPPMNADAEVETDEEAEAEDDDCAIVEQRTDIIEVDSDDEDESDEEEESDDQPTEPTAIRMNPKQLRICSDTESIVHDESSNDSQWVRRKETVERDTEYKITEQPVKHKFHTKDATLANDSTEIEVVVNKVEETTIVEDYYYEEYSEDEGRETMKQQNHDDDEVMEIEDDDDETSNDQEKQEDEEETEELIEIIEGDIDLELDDGQEYKVVEVVDGDFEMELFHVPIENRDT